VNDRAEANAECAVVSMAPLSATSAGSLCVRPYSIASFALGEQIRRNRKASDFAIARLMICCFLDGRTEIERK